MSRRRGAFRNPDSPVRESDPMREVLNHEFVAQASPKRINQQQLQVPGLGPQGQFLPPITRGWSGNPNSNQYNDFSDNSTRASDGRQNLNQIISASRNNQQPLNLGPQPSVARSTSQLSPRVGGHFGGGADPEASGKVRHLELNLLDFKGAVDRRLTEITQEMPNRLAREIKAFELREGQLAKDVAQKIAMIQDGHIRTKDALKTSIVHLQEQVQQLEVGQQQQDYKLQAAMKQLEIHSVQLQNLQHSGAAGGGNQLAIQAAPQSQQNYDYQTQVQFLRDALQDQKSKHDQLLAEQQRAKQDMHNQLKQVESDMMNRLKEQRDNHLQIFQQVEDEKMKHFRMEGEKSSEHANMMKNILATIERKVEEEVTNRQRDNLDSKAHTEAKLMSLVEKLKTDEKGALERERRLMEQVQEGLTTMNDIIKGTKEQASVSLTQQQAAMGDQLGNQSQSLDEIKTYVFGRQNIIEGELSDVKQRLIDLEEATLKHANHVNGVVESEMNRFEKIITAIEKHQVNSSEEFKKQLDLMNQENVKWRVDYEDINAKKIVEIHNALKVLNGQSGKRDTDWKERCDTLAQEIKLLESAIQAQISDVKDLVTDGDSNMDERAQVAVSRIQEKVKLQIDENLLELKNRFNENLELIEQKFKQNNTQVKTFVEKMTQQGLQKLNEDRQEKDTVLEGRAQAFTVESERKLIQKINLLFGRVDALKEVVQKKGYASKEAVDDLAGDKVDGEDGSKVVKSAGGKAAEVVDHGEREAAIKEWAMNQMKENYEDFERLLGAKYTELRAMIELSAKESGKVPEDFDPEEYALEGDMEKIREWIDIHEPKINLMFTRLDGAEDGLHRLEINLRGGNASPMLTGSKQAPLGQANAYNSASQPQMKTLEQQPSPSQTPLKQQQFDEESLSQTVQKNDARFGNARASNPSNAIGERSSIEAHPLDASINMPAEVHLTEADPIAVSQTKSQLDASMNQRSAMGASQKRPSQMSLGGQSQGPAQSRQASAQGPSPPRSVISQQRSVKGASELGGKSPSIGGVQPSKSPAASVHGASQLNEPALISENQSLEGGFEQFEER